MSSQHGVRQPGGLAGRWIRAVVSFGVGVTIGLAPFLGLVNIPPFTALLAMIPESLRPTTIPIAAALMGTIAVAVQWYGGESVSRSWLKKRFGIALAAAIISVFAFMFVQSTYVVTVRAEGGKVTHTFVVGLVRQPACQCPPGSGDARCIDGLGCDESAVEECWGDRAVRQARNFLRSSYLVATCSFAILVGLLLLRRSD
jgi:hypothetical protein